MNKKLANNLFRFTPLRITHSSTFFFLSSSSLSIRPTPFLPNIPGMDNHGMDPYHHELGMAVPPNMMPLLSDRRGVGKQNLVDPRLMQGKCLFWLN